MHRRRSRIRRACLHLPWLALFFWLARPSEASLLAGAALMLLGLSLRLWAAGTMKKNRILATTGPYALVRHPLYAGGMFLALGACVAAWSWAYTIVTLAGFIVIYAYTILREERRLQERFGVAWDTFAAETPRLLPLRGTSLDRLRGDFSWAQVLHNREERRLSLLAMILGVAYWFKIAPHISHHTALLQLAMIVLPVLGAAYLLVLACQRRISALN